MVLERIFMNDTKRSRRVFGGGYRGRHTVERENGKSAFSVSLDDLAIAVCSTEKAKSCTGD